MKTTNTLAVALLSIAALGAGCSSTGAKTNTRSSATARAAQVSPASTGKLYRSPAPQKLYFDYDAYQLDAQSLDALDDYADFLRKNPNARLTITGHADERGPTEYNLMLGEARARAARRYLINLGVSRDQIRLVSYGEEQPAVVGAGEEAWSQNRRDELAIQMQ